MKLRNIGSFATQGQLQAAFHAASKWQAWADTDAAAAACMAEDAQRRSLNNTSGAHQSATTGARSDGDGSHNTSLELCNEVHSAGRTLGFDASQLHVLVRCNPAQFHLLHIPTALQGGRQRISRSGAPPRRTTSPSSAPCARCAVSRWLLSLCLLAAPVVCCQAMLLDQGSVGTPAGQESADQPFRGTFDILNGQPL